MTALRQLATILGGDVAGNGVVCPGPGHSPRDRSLSVILSPTAQDGFIANSFAGDDWRTCRDHVLERLGRARRPVVQKWTPVHADHSALAVRLFETAQDPGQLVRDYHGLRGLILPDDVAGRVVRFHPRCPFGQERRPAMILAFRDIRTDRLTGIHRVAIAPDGKKIGRMMLGTIAGAAIKIDPDDSVEQGLVIGEGYETCLAGRMMNFSPVWATGSAGGMAIFPALSGIDALTVLAETDDSGTNAAAVETCGRRWLAAGREVLRITPRIGGDMNDLVMP